MTRTPLRVAALFIVLALLAGCYPRYDWRDYRPDCARGFCAFVASFPGKVTSARREIAVGATRLPLTLHVISVGDVTFAVGAFNLQAGGDVAAARATFERKLLDDVGATEGRRGRLSIHASDRSEIAADTFDAEGSRGGKALRASARFAERHGYLVEMLVIGPVDVLSTGSGRQAVETFLTSLRLD
jgi:hypothetical protein